VGYFFGGNAMALIITITVLILIALFSLGAIITVKRKAKKDREKMLQQIALRFFGPEASTKIKREQFIRAMREIK
jgi:hypothetical protein